MKKLGEGWQYTVYDMGDGRVYKKLKSSFRRFLYIYFHSKESIISSLREVKRMKVYAENSFKIINENRIPRKWIGNPELFLNMDYSQDKVTPLQNVFDTCNTVEGKIVVDKFIDFIKKLLELGYIDFSFRISANFGLNSEGNVVLMDLGEIIDDPIIIHKQRKAEYWHYNYMKDYIKDSEVRKYFQEQMDLNFRV